MGPCGSKWEANKHQEDLNATASSLLSPFLSVRFSFCPKNHPATSIRKISSAENPRCSACSKKSSQKHKACYFACNQCNYQLCSKCFKPGLKHSDICANPILKVWKNSSFVGVSCVCTFCKQENYGIMYCKACTLFGCMKCMKNGQKKIQCSHRFKTQDDKIMLCPHCQRRSKGFSKCQKCRIQICGQCCQHLNQKPINKSSVQTLLTSVTVQGRQELV